MFIFAFLKLPSGDRITKKNIYIILFAVSCLILALNISWYMPFFADDSLITIRYAQRLIDGHGLTWTDGIKVEGYSNLLWVLILAFFGKMGANMILVARLLGVLFAITNIYLLISYANSRYKNAPAILTLALFLFSASSVVAVWAIGGLENSLVSMLALLSIIRYLDYRQSGEIRSLWLASVSLGLLCITRPDGVLLSIILGLYHLISNKDDIKKAFISLSKLAVFPLILYFGQLTFRILYYGELVPNTAHVKVSPSLYHAFTGIMYTLRFFKSNFSLFIIAMSSLAYMVYRKKSEYLLYIMLLGIWASYIAFIGGDFFFAFRHHLFTIIVFMMVIIDGMGTFLEENKLENSRKKIAIILLSLLMIFYLYQQITDDNNTRSRKSLWVFNLQTLGEKLKITFGDEQPLIAVDPAGSLPYFTMFPALDMLGLNDYHIPRNKPENMGKGFIGHELGDPEYVLDSKPDIIQFHIGTREPILNIDTMLVENKRFQDRYIDVAIFAEGEYEYSGVLYFDKYSRKVGIDSTNGKLEIPSYLFRADTEVFNIFEGSELVTPLEPNKAFSFVVPYIINPSAIKTIPNGLDIESTKNRSTGLTRITVTNPSEKKVIFKKVIIQQ